jgi:hypothetical protein
MENLSVTLNIVRIEDISLLDELLKQFEPDAALFFKQIYDLWDTHTESTGKVGH